MAQDEAGNSDSDNEERTDQRAIYRPPKVAPMPYAETSRDKTSKKRQGAIPTALSSLTRLDASQPHMESSSGLGSMPSMASGRARELQEMTRFEEDNMTRLVMKKKDHLKRLRDEGDIALGGMGTTGRGRVSGFAGEFADVLRSVGRTKHTRHGDGYDELRSQGKKDTVLDRSRTRKHQTDVDQGTGREGRPRKKSRFETEVKLSKRRQKKRS